jgi:hypothetical protein
MEVFQISLTEITILTVIEGAYVSLLCFIRKGQNYLAYSWVLSHICGHSFTGMEQTVGDVVICMSFFQCAVWKV